MEPSIQRETFVGSLSSLKFTCVKLLGSFSNDDGDGNENVKKAIGLDKQNNSARASCFFVYFFTDVKLPNFIFYGGRKQATAIFFFFLNLSAVPKKSIPGKFAYI